MANESGPAATGELRLRQWIRSECTGLVILQVYAVATNTQVREARLNVRRVSVLVGFVNAIVERAMLRPIAAKRGVRKGSASLGNLQGQVFICHRVAILPLRSFSSRRSLGHGDVGSGPLLPSRY